MNRKPQSVFDRLYKAETKNDLEDVRDPPAIGVTKEAIYEWQENSQGWVRFTNCSDIDTVSRNYQASPGELQSRIDEASSDGGGVVYAEPGVYQSRIKIKSDVSVIGAGVSDSSITNVIISPLNQNSVAVEMSGDRSSLSGVHIRSTNNRGIGIQINSRCYLNNCWIDGWNKNIEYINGTNVRTQNLTLRNGEEYNFHLSGNGQDNASLSRHFGLECGNANTSIRFDENDPTDNNHFFYGSSVQGADSTGIKFGSGVNGILFFGIHMENQPVDLDFNPESSDNYVFTDRGTPVVNQGGTNNVVRSVRELISGGMTRWGYSPVDSSDMCGDFGGQTVVDNVGAGPSIGSPHDLSIWDDTEQSWRYTMSAREVDTGSLRIPAGGSRNVSSGVNEGVPIDSQHWIQTQPDSNVCVTESKIWDNSISEQVVRFSEQIGTAPVTIGYAIWRYD